MDTDQQNFRQQTHDELERVRADFHRLLDGADRSSLARRSDGTRWTNEQLLFHMLFGYLIVRALLPIVRGFSRMPNQVGGAYARLLDWGTVPFDASNYVGSVIGARVYGHRRMGAKMDRVISALHRRLDAETENDLARGMHFPARWDPFFDEVMTVAEVFRYPAKHYDFHRRQLTLTG